MTRSLPPALKAMTVDEMWRIYCAEVLPPQEVTTSYSIEQVREAFTGALWAALTLEQRTRSRRRAQFFNRLRNESRNLLRSFGQL